VCCSVFQYLQRGAALCSKLHCVTYVNSLEPLAEEVCCSVLQCVAVCCNVLQCATVYCRVLPV